MSTLHATCRQALQRSLRLALSVCLTGALAASLILPAAALQSGGQQAEPDQRPTFRTTIDSVSVDVIVLDRSGQPVDDLTAADFEVREDGKLQQIEAFKFIDVDSTAMMRPTTHREILSLEDQRREAARDDTRLLVILLDDYHVRRGNGLRVREQLADFVLGLAPNDLVALAYPLSAGAGLTFSRNHENTALMLMGFEGRKYDYTPRNAFEERYQMQPPQVLERMRNEVTIRAIESLAIYMGGLRDGRKTLLLVSEGMSGTLPAGVNTTGAFPFGSGTTQVGQVNDRTAFFNQTELMSQLRYAFAAAGRSNTAVYTLDPRGLAASEYDIDDAVSYETDRRILAESMDSLRAIAEETDGQAIVNRNDPLPELQQMVRDTSAYYLLGYTSTEAPRDGKFHEIEVTVSRPGVEIRARKGYWAYTAEEAEAALAPPRPEAPADVREALDALAAAETPAYRAVSIWLGATSPGGGEPSRVTLAWEAMSDRRQGRDAEDVAEVEVVAASLDGRVLFRGTAPRGDSLLVPAGRVSFASPPGPIRLQLRVKDRSGADIDSDQIAWDVPDYDGAGLVVTPPEVFRGRTARDIQRLRDAESPVPTAARAFSRTERLLLRFAVHWPPADNGGDEVVLNLLNDLGETMAAVGTPTRLDDGTYEAVIALSALPPGDFLIEIAARAAGDSARSLLAIRVTG